MRKGSRSEDGGGFWPRFMVLAVVVLWVSLLGGNWVGKYVMEHSKQFVIKPDEYRPFSDQRSKLRGRPPVLPESVVPKSEKPAESKTPAPDAKESSLPPVADVPEGTENPDEKPARARTEAPRDEAPKTQAAAPPPAPEGPDSKPEPAAEPSSPGGDDAGNPENEDVKSAPAPPVPTPERSSQQSAPDPPRPTPAGPGTEG